MVSAAPTDTILQPAGLSKPSLAGLTRDGLKAALAAAGVPEKQLRMRVGQLWGWIYAHGVTSFDQMSDVSKELRRTLADLLDPSEDRAHVFQLDPRMRRDMLGRATEPVTDVFLIV